MAIVAAALLLELLHLGLLLLHPLVDELGGLHVLLLETIAQLGSHRLPTHLLRAHILTQPVRVSSVGGLWPGAQTAVCMAGTKPTHC